MGEIEFGSLGEEIRRANIQASKDDVEQSPQREEITALPGEDRGDGQAQGQP